MPLQSLAQQKNPLTTVGLPGKGLELAQVIAPNQSEVTIPNNTEVFLSTIDEISSKTAKTGDLIELRVDEDVLVDGKKVIIAGTHARAEIAEAKKAGFFGKGGKLSLKILSTSSVDGVKVPLIAATGTQGGGNLGASVAVFALVSPLGFLIKGHTAVIPAGTKVRAVVDGRTKVIVTQE